jgi:hypothetical protein
MPGSGPAQIDEARVRRSPDRVGHRNGADVADAVLDQLKRLPPASILPPQLSTLLYGRGHALAACL